MEHITFTIVEHVNKIQKEMDSIEQSFALIRGMLKVLEEDYKDYDSFWKWLFNDRKNGKNLSERHKLIKRWQKLIERYSDLNNDCKTLLKLI